MGSCCRNVMESGRARQKGFIGGKKSEFGRCTILGVFVQDSFGCATNSWKRIYLTRLLQRAGGLQRNRGVSDRWSAFRRKSVGSSARFHSATPLGTRALSIGIHNPHLLALLHELRGVMYGCRAFGAPTFLIYESNNY